MPTRFYFPSTPEAPVAVAPDAAWSVTGSQGTGTLATVKTASATTALSGEHDGGAATNVLLGQYVSAPLTAQSVTGTVKGQFRCSETSADMNGNSQVVIRIVSGDGSTVRGVLLAAQSSALTSEWNAISGRNRKMPLAALSPATLSAVSAQDGDRLVVEIGARGTGPDIDAFNLSVGDAAGSDLPEDETSLLGLDPWMEFSGTLTFQSTAVVATPQGRMTLSLGVGL